MTNFRHKPGKQEEIDRQAAAWVLRCDRGLSAPEQDEFSDWLAADPRHGAQLARHREHWKRLDVLAGWRLEHSDQPNPDLLAPPLKHRFRKYISLSLAAAAAVVIGAFFLRQSQAPAPPPKLQAVASAAAGEQRILPDGSVVVLNEGATIRTGFSAMERRVFLESGEAYFTVTKDVSRPFIVAAHHIEVRAVGTAFNVRMDSDVVEVLVTEGRVEVEPVPTDAADVGWPPKRIFERPSVPLLEARQRMIVPVMPVPDLPQVATLTHREIARVLAWQHRLLEFTGAPLSEIVAEFNRRNAVQIVITDPALGATRMSAIFRSDNVDALVRLVRDSLGVSVERRNETEILLSAPR